MPTITFIRHGKKKYKNNKGPPGCYQHDPDIYHIQNSSLEKIYNQSNFKIIVSSPYKRALNTSLCLKSYLQKRGLCVDIIIEPGIGEYLGNQRPIGKMANLDPITKRYINPKLGTENFNNIKKRMLHSFQKIKRLNTDVLVITHGLNISVLQKSLDFHNRMSLRMPVEILSGFSYHEDTIRPFLI